VLDRIVEVGGTVTTAFFTVAQAGLRRPPIHPDQITAETPGRRSVRP
jgi:hypothetical protein